MHRAIYERLKQVARAQNLTTYGQIAPLAGLDMASPDDRNKIASILGEISTYEHEHDRPMLSAVVVHQDTNVPGHGFFVLARELGRHTATGPLADLEFFTREVRKVYATWSLR